MINESELGKNNGDNPQKTSEKLTGFERTRVEDLTPAEQEQAAYWLSEAEKENSAPETQGESGPEILALESDMDSFEANHSLERLNEIGELSKELFSLFAQCRDLSEEKIGERLQELSEDEQEKFTVRFTANKDLISLDLAKRMKVLEKMPDANEDKLIELKARYKKLSNAVGFMNAGRIRHE